MTLAAHEDAITSEPDLTLQMPGNAMKKGTPAKNVLFDSWFSAPKTLIAISKLKLFVVDMMKITSKKKVLFENEPLDMKQIYSRLKKRRGRSKYLACADLVFGDKKNGSIPPKLVFVRDRVIKINRLVLVSSEVSLKAEELIVMYGIRWDIEAFFKINKSFLRMTTDFQGQSFEMQNAHKAANLS